MSGWEASQRECEESLRIMYEVSDADEGGEGGVNKCATILLIAIDDRYHSFSPLLMREMMRLSNLRSVHYRVYDDDAKQAKLPRDLPNYLKRYFTTCKSIMENIEEVRESRRKRKMKEEEEEEEGKGEKGGEKKKKDDLISSYFSTTEYFSLHCMRNNQRLSKFKSNNKKVVAIGASKSTMDMLKQAVCGGRSGRRSSNDDNDDGDDVMMMNVYLITSNGLREFPRMNSSSSSSNNKYDILTQFTNYSKEELICSGLLQRINIITGTASKIVTEDKQIYLENNDLVVYDKLVIGVG